MPSNTSYPFGVGTYDNTINSGAEQFFISVQAGGPPTPVAITFARLTNGLEFPGITAYVGGSNASPGSVWTNSVLNFVLARLSQTSIGPFFGVETVTGGFPDDPDVVPLWILDVNGAGAFNAILDARPWFDGGSGGGTNSVAERLKEILQHSVMEDYLFDSLESVTNIDGGVSTGSFLGPNRYELSPGEILQSNFAAAPPAHLAVINQPYVAVLPDQLINAVTDIKIRVSRIASPGTSGFPGAATANWTDVPANFSLVDLTAATGTNVLNIAIYNPSGGTYEIAGWGIYSNPVTAPGGVIVPGAGIVLGSTGLRVINTTPKAAWTVSDGGVTFTWDATVGAPLGRLSWDLTWKLNFWVGGSLYSNTITGPGNLDGISVDGYYVYADLDLENDGAVIVPQVSPGPPLEIQGRVILARRFSSALHLQSGVVLVNAAGSGTKSGYYPGVGIDLNKWTALINAAAATGANRYATLADITAGFISTAVGFNSVIGGNTIVSSAQPVGSTTALFMYGLSNPSSIGFGIYVGGVIYSGHGVVDSVLPLTGQMGPGNVFANFSGGVASISKNIVVAHVAWGVIIWG